MSPTGSSAAAFRALSDHTRREILTLLRARPRTSGEIADHFRSSWPTISRHLAVLRQSGLVVAERRGQEIYYELNTSVFQDLLQYLMEWAKPAPGEDLTRSRKQRRAQGRQEA